MSNRTAKKGNGGKGIARTPSAKRRRVPERQASKSPRGPLSSRTSTSEPSDRRLRLIAQVAGVVVGAKPLVHRAKEMARHVCQELGVEACIIRLLDRGKLVLLANAGISKATLFPAIPTTWGVTRKMLARRQPVFVPNVHASRISAPIKEHLRRPFRFRSYAGTPLLAKGRVIGVMGVYWSSASRGFGKADLACLKTVGNTVAAAIVNDQLYEEMRHQRDRLKSETRRRRRVEASLRQSEEKFRAMFDSAFQLTGLLSPEGVLLEANQAALDACGLRIEEVRGRPFWECPWWTRSSRAQKQLKASVARAARGEFVRYEVDLRGLDGRTVTVDFSLKPLVDATGRVTLIIPEGRDITERRQIEAQLRQNEETHLNQMRRLARDTERLREEERAEVSRHLHDGVGQALTSLMMRLAWVEKRIRTTAPSLSGELNAACSQARQMIDDIRRVAKSLRPVANEHEGLVSSVRSFLNEFERLSGVRCRVTVRPESLVVREPLATAIYRIIQEAMTNVARHACASRCEIRLTAARDSLGLIVQDNGRGATPDVLLRSDSLGVLGMRERAAAVGGSLWLESPPKAGVAVRARFPFTNA
jgi:PAS domain S-box-containing protein